MSDHGGADQRASTPALPTEIWVVAWASLAGQVVLLLGHGIHVTNEVSLVGSVVLGALLVGFVSAGVVRARTFRLVLAWVVTALGALGSVFSLVAADDLGEAAFAVLSLVASVVTLVGLSKFRSTDWYAWQRTKPSTREGAPIGRLVAIGVLVGVMAGFVGPVDNGLDVNVSVDGG